MSEGLVREYTFLIGNVTIELARMIEHAMPQQILVGDFDVPMLDEEKGDVERINSIEFIRRTRGNLSQLNGLILSGDAIDAIKCYLTGSARDDGTFDVSKHKVVDKHGLTRYVYNAKVNSHRQSARTLYLGIQDSRMETFDAVQVEEVNVPREEE